MPGALGLVPHDELAPLYERAAVVAVPSHREGFGVACAEAMAHGRPVVASAVGGLLDLVVDGETGLLVPPRDVQALRAALERLLGDAGLRRRLGEAGRERDPGALHLAGGHRRDDPGLRGRACRLSGPQSCSACSGPGSRSRAASAAAACR